MFRIGRGAGRRREPRLDPVRWPRTPRRSTVVRGALVAILLTTAAGVLYAGAPAPAGCPVAESKSPRPVTPSPTAPPPGASSPGPTRPGAPDDQPSGGRLPLPPGAVGVPVTLADPMTLAVVRPGDRVDLLTVPAGQRTDDSAPRTSTVATGALVLAAGTGGGHGGEPGALFLALTPEQARKTVELQATTRFAIIVR
jgi:hypothetical protein